MMPLTVANPGEEMLILKVGGREKTSRHLENMGIVPGGYISVVNEKNGDLIVKVKESRIALSKELAMKIMV